MSHDGSDQTGSRQERPTGMKHPPRRRVEIAMAGRHSPLTFARDLPHPPATIGNIPSPPFMEARAMTGHRETGIIETGKNKTGKNKTGKNKEKRKSQPPLPALSAQEHKTIQTLLEACTDLERQGEKTMSALVDRIGMTMMRSYLNRAGGTKLPQDRRGQPFEFPNAEPHRPEPSKSDD